MPYRELESKRLSDKKFEFEHVRGILLESACKSVQGDRVVGRFSRKKDGCEPVAQP